MFNLGKARSTLKLIEEIIYHWKRIFILYGNLIQLTVVYTHPKRPIILPNKQDWSAMEFLSNKSFNCSFSSFISVGAILYGGIEIGRVSGIMSMPKSSLFLEGLRVDHKESLLETD